jgi:tetratricopeptide (TPR) repeat protein
LGLHGRIGVVNSPSTGIGFCVRHAARIVCSLLFLGSGFLSGKAVAAADEITKTEYDLLPPYCQGQEHVAPQFFKPDGNKWKNRLGNDYNHLHHYCWGLVTLSKAYRASNTEQERKYLFHAVLGDILYSVDRSSPGFALLPEMYTRLGEAYLGLQDDRNAEAAFRKAWEANPSYWPPYVWWSQRLLKQGKTQEALTIAQEGKKNAPGSKALDKLIEDIQGGGKASHK